MVHKVPVAQSSAESEYNAEYTTVMYLSYFRMLIHELLNKDPDIFTEEYSLLILDRKSAMCMDNNVKDTKHTSHIARRVNFVSNGEIGWCEGGLKLADIGTKNVSEPDLTSRIKYIMVRLEN